MGWYCDTADRIVIVEAERDGERWRGTVTAIPRKQSRRVARGRITGGECTDPCGNDGWAGCSFQQRCTFRSTARGARVITTTVPYASAVLGVIAAVGARRGKLAVCGPQPWGEDAAPLAICSTAAHTVTVGWEEDALVLGVFEPGGGAVDGDGVSTAIVRVEVTPDGAGFRGDGAAMVFGDDGASVVIGDEIEACLAFARDER
jgi:hypothetical protein